jgi:hypothetical protein
MTSEAFWGCPIHQNFAVKLPFTPQQSQETNFFVMHRRAALAPYYCFLVPIPEKKKSLSLVLSLIPNSVPAFLPNWKITLLHLPSIASENCSLQLRPHLSCVKRKVSGKLGLTEFM